MFGLHDFRNKFCHSIVLLVIGLFFLYFFFHLTWQSLSVILQIRWLLLKLKLILVHSLLTRSYQMCPIIYFVLCFSILLSELNF